MGYVDLGSECAQLECCDGHSLSTRQCCLSSRHSEFGSFVATSYSIVRSCQCAASLEYCSFIELAKLHKRYSSADSSWRSCEVSHSIRHYLSWYHADKAKFASG